MQSYKTESFFTITPSTSPSWRSSPTPIPTTRYTRRLASVPLPEGMRQVHHDFVFGITSFWPTQPQLAPAIVSIYCYHEIVGSPHKYNGKKVSRCLSTHGVLLIAHGYWLMAHGFDSLRPTLEDGGGASFPCTSRYGSQLYFHSCALLHPVECISVALGAALLAILDRHPLPVIDYSLSVEVDGQVVNLALLIEHLVQFVTPAMLTKAPIIVFTCK